MRNSLRILHLNVASDGRLLDLRNLFDFDRRYLLLGLHRSRLVCQIRAPASLASCQEPFVKPVVLNVFLQDIIVEQIILDDRIANVLGSESDTKLSMSGT
jgi:hypothetical protein